MSMHDFIVSTLTQAFQPETLLVDNESYLHRSSGPDGETHFKVVLVSNHFNGLRLLQRHQAVNQVLASAFEEGLHALALHTYTPDEWASRQQAVPDSTKCQGKH